MKKEILEKLHNRNKNIICYGDINVGKTTNITFPLVSEMIKNNESLIVLDSKEEYINKYYDELKNKNYNIIILNLKDALKSECFNPLAYPYNLYKEGNVDKSLEYLEKIGKTIFLEKLTDEAFWRDSASDLFTGVTLGLFQDAKEDEINLNSVNLVINDTKKQTHNIDSLMNYFGLKDINSICYKYASTTVLSPEDTKGGILGVARQYLKPYVTREKLSIMMSKTTFNYSDILTKPTAIFLITRDDNKIVNRIANMFIEQIFTYLKEHKKENKFNFILDNFDDLDKVNELNGILSSGPSNGIKTVLSTRSFENLLNEYGSYITKLCDSIHVTKDQIEITSSNVSEVYNIEKTEEKTTNSNIEYPTLQGEKVQLFDLEKFLKKHTKNFKDLNIPKSTNDYIDDLIKDIDEKINELEQEEKKENNK